jgi:hypothetical protein
MINFKQIVFFRWENMLMSVSQMKVVEENIEIISLDSRLCGVQDTLISQGLYLIKQLFGPLIHADLG